MSDERRSSFRACYYRTLQHKVPSSQNFHSSTGYNKKTAVNWGTLHWMLLPKKWRSVENMTLCYFNTFPRIIHCFISQCLKDGLGWKLPDVSNRFKVRMKFWWTRCTQISFDWSPKSEWEREREREVNIYLVISILYNVFKMGQSSTGATGLFSSGCKTLKWDWPSSS